MKFPPFYFSYYISTKLEFINNNHCNDHFIKVKTPSMLARAEHKLLLIIENTKNPFPTAVSIFPFYSPACRSTWRWSRKTGGVAQIEVRQIADIKPVGPPRERHEQNRLTQFRHVVTSEPANP
jgi:hypothetical protein